MKLMLTCKQASLVISRSLDGPLSISDRMQLKLHLLICDACKRFNRQLRSLSNILKNLTQETENNNEIKLSSEAKIRIANAIDKSH